MLEQYPLALRAFQRADRMAEGKNAEAIMGMAEVLVQQDVEELRGRAGRMFERALELDPDLAQGPVLQRVRRAGPRRAGAGAAALRADAVGERDPDVACCSRRASRVPRNRRRVSSAAQSRLSRRSRPDAAKIAVHVTLAPALAAKMPGQRGLFVAARDPQAPGPPFAVKRLPARFPVDVELTRRGCDAASRDASRPGSNSKWWRAWRSVELRPRSSGDPFGQVSYHVGKDGKLNIVIDRLAPYRTFTMQAKHSLEFARAPAVWSMYPKIMMSRKPSLVPDGGAVPRIESRLTQGGHRSQAPRGVFGNLRCRRGRDAAHRLSTRARHAAAPGHARRGSISR